ncbi:HNH endonuclease family protein [Arthrobacter sp. H14-L1]|uniref:HNH endonuclease family protein n=1 Tax=Arthrobacter sp. H14-L1 TaxID=2996697 RepID=UPI00226DD506|nr:HNH endonuclease family protein [Arthrobacter sp. H14-L1]MCY0906293.1 HNH endonuclease family protein [Arthrobacter sp. H14-L1]
MSPRIKVARSPRPARAPWRSAAWVRWRTQRRRPRALAVAVPVFAALVALLAALYAWGPLNPVSAALAGQGPLVLEPGWAGSGSPVIRVKPALALSVLDVLQVQGRAPRNTYDRLAFGEPWLDMDRNGCDTRNDILARDLTQKQLVKAAGCQLGSGQLADPYTGRELDFNRGPHSSKAIQIDHVVALGNAWQTGAQQLTDEQRQSLANDPLNLLAVDGPTNVQKGDGDAATWLPPNKEFRCRYIARQVSVKAAYRLWVTPAEKDAMTRVLTSCPRQPTLESGYVP